VVWKVCRASGGMAPVGTKDAGWFY
jgi:hypothetical protein